MVIEHWSTLKGTPAGTPAALLKRFGQVKPPFDPYAVAAGVGVEVRHITDRTWSGAVRFEDRKAVVWLNDGEPRYRKRFTLAHELGHLMLHDGAKGLFRDSSFRGDPKEREANAFAADLVMPEWAIRRWGALVNFETKALSRIFSVSEDAVIVRMSIIGERIAERGLRF